MIRQSKLKSCLCTQTQLQSPDFMHWQSELHLPLRLHRKDWEYCFIAQALFERDLLCAGREGIGFAVGQEPLPAAFAKHGCSLLVTDLDADRAVTAGWRQSGMHAAELAELNRPEICSTDVFQRQVRFDVVDMNNIPQSLGPVDFVWSACALEHLGSLDAGLRFILRSLECLRPGGVAVHTTEFNVSSNEETVAEGGTVLYRRRDIDDLVVELRRQECHIEMDFGLGDTVADWEIDLPPFKQDPHFKLRLGAYVSTSIGLIIEKGAREISSTPPGGIEKQNAGEIYRRFVSGTSV